MNNLGHQYNGAYNRDLHLSFHELAEEPFMTTLPPGHQSQFQEGPPSHLGAVLGGPIAFCFCHFYQNEQETETYIYVKHEVYEPLRHHVVTT